MKSDPKLVSQRRGYRVKPWKKEPYKFVVFRYLHGEKVDAKFFTNLHVANEHARRENIRLKNEGHEAQFLDPVLRGMALEGSKILEPYGKTIRDAVVYYAAELQKLQGLRKAKLRDLVPVFLEGKRTDRRKPAKKRYLDTLKYRLEIMIEELGDVEVSEITEADVIDTIDSRGEISNSTFNNYLRDYRVFFNFAREEKYVAESPVARTEELTEDPKQVQVLRPDAMQALLTVASPRLRPVLALQGFAGIRRDEVQVFPWEEVNFETARVVPTKTKTGPWRPISMRPNLRAWLEAIPTEKRQGLVCNFRYREELAAARKKAGVTNWPHNCLRHSFASYCLVAEEDQGRLQIELGHTTPRMLMEHYRALVSPQAALAWWAIFPE